MSILARSLVAMSLLLHGPSAEAGEVRRDQQVASPALGGPLTFSVYLPDGYAPDRGPYPVVYLLHGLGANSRRGWTNGRIEEVLDGLIGAGELPGTIAIMPDANNSWYVDSAALGGPGDYETAIVRDLLRQVETTFGARADRGDRAVAGISMGGYGALRFAFFHPDLFGAVASLSGGLFEGVGMGPGGRTHGGPV